MAAVVQALGPGAGAAGGADSDEEYDRAADMADAWRAGRRPAFAVTRPVLANRRYGIMVSTYRYVFDPRFAWTPELIARELEAHYANWRTPNTLAVQVVAEIEEAAPAGRAPYPRREEAPPELRRALPAILNHAVRVWSTPVVPAARLGWATVRALLEREDRYDSGDGIEELYGNRLSRLVFKVREYTVPRGAGADEARRALGLPDRALVDIPADAPLCGQACLAYAVADGVTRGHMRARRSTANDRAAALAAEIGVAGPMALADFDAFAAARPAWRVVVMRSRDERLCVASRGLAASTVYLLLHENHYYYIASIDLFVKPTPDSRVRWCHGCLAAMPGGRLRSHVCGRTCGGCGAYLPTPEAAAAHAAPSDRRCAGCGERLLYEGCAAAHRCRRWSCAACGGAYPLSRRAAHVCGERHCAPCDAYYAEAEGHRCFVRRLRPAREPPAAPERLWALDLECARGPDGEQVVALGVARRVYGDEFVVCRGEAALYAWLDALPAGTTLFTHNGAKYDTFLIFDMLLRRSPVAPDTTFVGLKLLKLRWKGATFLDSYRHLAQGLAACARSFGLAEAKGYFPYDFFTVENATYVGPPPEPEAFTAATRASEGFAEWHAGKVEAWRRRRVPYDIAAECEAYCRQDVALLAEILRRYRDAGVAETGVDPLTKATVASYALAAYRTRDMPEGAIATLLPAEDAFARRGLKGGRVDARQVARAWTPAEVAAGGGARYADVNSLYPWVLAACPLPVGPPRWEPADAIADPAAYLASLGPDLALVECDVTCPDDLYHPVLVCTDPDGRLRATLEPKVAQVFTSVELAAATARGYTVTRIRAAMRFEARAGALFGAYVGRYYDLKRAAGARGDRAAYALAKVMMNSLWGKFAQRPSEGEVTTYKDPERWYRDLTLAAGGRLHLEPRLEAEGYVVAVRRAEEARPPEATNAALAAFVTAHARLRLYGALEALGERVIYHDTDSVIYEAVAPDPLDYGPGLGQWKDECGGEPIVRVCCLGPKTYAYRLAGGREVVKSKGFSAPFTLADYERAAAAYFAGAPARLSAPSESFVRRLGGGIRIVPGERAMLPLMDKLVVIGPARTLPRGHREARA